MNFWKKIFGKNTPRTNVAATQSSKTHSTEVEQVKKRLASHPDYEVLKNSVANFGGSKLSGDEVMNIVADVVAKNKKK